MKYYAITCIRGHQGARNDNALITFYVEAKDIIAAAKVAQRMAGLSTQKCRLIVSKLQKKNTSSEGKKTHISVLWLNKP